MFLAGINRPQHIHGDQTKERAPTPIKSQIIGRLLFAHLTSFGFNLKRNSVANMYSLERVYRRFFFPPAIFMHAVSSFSALSLAMSRVRNLVSNWNQEITKLNPKQIQLKQSSNLICSPRKLASLGACCARRACRHCMHGSDAALTVE